MGDRLMVRCWSARQGHEAMKSMVWPSVKAALESGRRVIVEVREETRSLDQNARLWAMLTEVSKQVVWHGAKLSPEDWKDVFTAALRRERVVPGINGGFVVLGQRTSRMTKAEMADLQMLIEAFGAERGIVFKDAQHADTK